MTKVVTFFLTVLILASFAFSQEAYKFVSEFPVGSTLDAYGQGLAVDGAGNIWYTPYYTSDSVEVDTSGDGVVDEWQKCRAIYAFQPDGTPLPFSPIKIITVDGAIDTLWNSNRGLRTDPDGNIAAGSWCVYYLINHETGEGMKKLLPYPIPDTEDPWDGESIVAADFDSEGNMFVNAVVASKGPIKAFDADWDLIDDVVPVDNLAGYSRNISVSADGNDIYFCNFTGSYGLIRFHSNDGVDGDYLTKVDSLLEGLSVETSNWSPKTGYLWCGSTTTSGPYTQGSWYALDPATDTIVDSLKWNGELDGAKPRGTAFSAGGDTIYVCTFNTWNVDAIQMFTMQPTGIWRYERSIVDGYSLDQNYPNPFNPSTTIPFKISKAGFTTLKVYNTLGQEVATLINKDLQPGEYKADFNGSNLASGIYIYNLKVNGVKLTGKMNLVK